MAWDQIQEFKMSRLNHRFPEAPSRVWIEADSSYANLIRNEHS